MERPDALFIPVARRRGRNGIERVNSIADIAEPLLGGRAYIRRQPGDRASPGGWLFITTDPDDTILYPNGDGRRGERYAWIPQPDGILFGFLRDVNDRRSQ